MEEFPRKYYTQEFGAELLQKVPVFSLLSAMELGRLYTSGELLITETGANILIQGESTSGLYVILEGLVGVWKSVHGNGSHLLTTLSPGQCFGELSLLDRQPRSATVTSQGRSVLFHLGQSPFDELLARDVPLKARLMENFATVLAQRLRTLDEEFITSQKQLWQFVLNQKSA